MIVNNNNIRYDYHYDENWFLNPSTEYQHELVQMSIREALAAYGSTTITNGKSIPYGSHNINMLMNDLEYKNIVCDYPEPEYNSIGYAIGSKNITTDNGAIVK